MDHIHTFLTTQGHGGPPRMSDQPNAGATSETTQTWKTIHTKHIPSHPNKTNMERWIRRPNDSRGPKVSRHLSYRWGKTPKKPHPGNLTRQRWTKKVSPLKAWRPTGDVDARVHVFTATALWWGRVAIPTLGRLYPGEIPRYSFYRRLSGPQGQSGHEGMKKNFHPSDTRDRTRTVQPVVKRLAAWATWPTYRV